MYIYIYIYIVGGARRGARQAAQLAARWLRSVFMISNRKNNKLSVSSPKSKYVAYLSVLSQISNCQGLGRKNKHDILKTDRTRYDSALGHVQGRAVRDTYTVICMGYDCTLYSNIAICNALSYSIRNTYMYVWDTVTPNDTLTYSK